MSSSENNNHQVKYLRIIADMKPNSLIMPLKVIFDEREFMVSEVFDIKKIVVAELGELCYAYYCKFNNKIRILYLDKLYNWFVIWHHSTKEYFFILYYTFH